MDSYTSSEKLAIMTSFSKEVSKERAGSSNYIIEAATKQSREELEQG